MFSFKNTCLVLLLILFIALAARTLTQVAAITWSDYEVRLTTYADFDGLSTIIETDDRRLWIFWSRHVESSYEIFCKNSSDGGNTWSQATQLTMNASANTGVSAFQASDGKIWVAWSSDRTGNYEIFYKVSSDLGASWSNDTQLTVHPSHDLKPVIRQMLDDTIWVAWSSDRTGDYDLYLKTSSDNGASWSGAVRLTTDPNLDKSPSICQMSDDKIWLVWASDREGVSNIYSKTSSDFGASWSPLAQLTVNPKIDTNPFILQTLDDKIWIFWSRRDSATYDDIHYMYSCDNGATWPEIVQFTTDKYDDTWPSAVQTQDLKIWVVWTSDRADQPDWGNWDLYHKISLVGDINEDGVVDVFDISIVSMAFGSFAGSPQYNPDADLNVDGIVDMIDLSLVAINYGAT